MLMIAGKGGNAVFRSTCQADGQHGTGCHIAPLVDLYRHTFLNKGDVGRAIDLGIHNDCAGIWKQRQRWCLH